MPETRNQIAERRREEILDAALRVFSSKGFNQATNQDIARAAGFSSPGLIYHYFKDQQDLLQHLLQRLNPALDALLATSSFQTLSLREGLCSLAEGFERLNQDEKSAATLRIVLSEALLGSETAARVFAAGPGRFLAALAPWLLQHIEKNQLRREPKEVLARQFLAPFFMATMFHVIFQTKDHLEPGWAQRHVDLFLRGAAL